jgi:hypothetical protein
MGKTRRRVATVATIAGIGGLGAVALGSNPGHQVSSFAGATAAHTGRPIVTSSSGSTGNAVLVQNTNARMPTTHRPVVTRTSGGATAGSESKDD